MAPAAVLTIYCLLIGTGSLLGGWLPSWMQLTHTRLQLLTSTVAGLMLGVGLFHLLPHGLANVNSIDTIVAWMMAGILSMFFLLRLFHVHVHDPSKLGADGQCGHTPSSVHREHVEPIHVRVHTWSWLGVACGLSLHTIIDGMALAASVKAEASHGDSEMFFFGLGTFLAIVAHKPLDAVSITSLMSAGGWSRRLRTTVNVGFALMCPIGAAAFYVGASKLASEQHLVVGSALGFSAGVFICIALADLLPEIEFHSHDRLKLSGCLLIGVALAYGIGFLEPEHIHGPNTAVDSHQHGSEPTLPP